MTKRPYCNNIIYLSTTKVCQVPSLVHKILFNEWVEFIHCFRLDEWCGNVEFIFQLRATIEVVNVRPFCGHLHCYHREVISFVCTSKVPLNEIQ